MKTKKKNIFSYIIAPVITIIFILVIYAIKGIYPFGLNSVIDFDLYQVTLSVYYNLYDAFHNGNFLYDFISACGLDRNIIIVALNPINWFFLFFKREMIVNAVSLFFLLKFVLISLSASFSFNNIFKKLSYPSVQLVSLIYTFCGFSLVYNTNIDWLDTVALYPLLIYCLLRCFNGKSKVPFIVILSYLLVFNTYMAYFVVLSLVIFGGLYIFIVDDKEKQKEHIYSLGFSTLCSLIISAYPIYNYFKSIFSTARYNIHILDNKNVDSSYSSLSILEKYISKLSDSIDFELTCALSILGLEFSLVCIVLLWCKFKKDKASRKYTVFFTSTIILLLCQIFFHNVNLLWHFGSYASFPFRNGYMLAFFACCSIAYYLQRFDDTNKNEYKHNYFKLIIPILCVFSFVIVVPYLKLSFDSLSGIDIIHINGNIMSKTTVFPVICSFCAVSLALLIFSLIKNKKIRNVFVYLLIVSTLFLNSLTFLGCRVKSEECNKKLQQYEYCDEVMETSEKLDLLTRTINPDLSVIVNYPYYTRLPAVSQWTHTLTGEQMNSFSNLGFHTVFTRVLDAGGTVFSKSLLRINDAFSQTELDSRLYTQYAQSESGFNYYHSNFVLPVGLFFDEGIDDISYENYSNTFEYQNAIYSALGGAGDLFVPANISTEVQSKNQNVKDAFDNVIDKEDVLECHTTISVSDDSVLYLKVNNNAYFDDITLNGYKLSIPDNEGTSMTVFPHDYNGNILELGYFGNETVTLDYTLINGDLNDIFLYSMSVDKMSELCSTYDKNEYTVDYNHISLSVNCDSDKKTLMLPLSYSTQWNCTVNGEKVEPKCVLGNFFSFELENGNNDIELNLSYKNIYLTAACLFLGILIVTIFIVIDKKLKSVPNWILKSLRYIFIAMFSIGVVLLYIIPVIYLIFT